MDDISEHLIWGVAPDPHLIALDAKTRQSAVQTLAAAEAYVTAHATKAGMDLCARSVAASALPQAMEAMLRGYVDRNLNNQEFVQIAHIMRRSLCLVIAGIVSHSPPEKMRKDLAQMVSAIEHFAETERTARAEPEGRG